MSLGDFFESSESKTPPKPKEKAAEEVPVKEEKPATSLPPTIHFEPQEFEVGQDMDDLLLLDVQYNAPSNVAQCIFYHEPSRSLYRWNDVTGHKPYLLTMLSQESLEKIPEVVKSKEFIRTEKVSMYYPLESQAIELLKVYGENPLSIGGRTNSFRNYIEPSFEADIRYHFNYLADKRLTPGTYYHVKDSQLLPVDLQMDSEVSSQLSKEFEDENDEEIAMLQEYMPLLFQNIPDILRCAFDIEVASTQNRMPNTNNPKDQVISIALVDTDGRRICWVLNTPYVDQDETIDGVEILRFDNEAELLLHFFEMVDKYPIVLSFNGDNFDCPYLINRAKLLGMADADIPMKIRGGIQPEASFDSAIHVDLHRFFRERSIRIYAFSAKYDSASLEELSTTLLGEGKLQHPDVWINEMDLRTLVGYNVKDTELTLRLSQFDNNVVLELIFIMMRICKMPIFDFTRTAVSGWLKQWLMFEHRKRNCLIPRKEDIQRAKGTKAISDATIEGKKFQGAIVLDPEPGIWWDVHVLDFASLYPSIIKTRNLSYETILCGHEECASNVVPEVGHHACTKNIGLFAIILGFVRDTRVKWFKPRSSDPSLSEMERRTNDVIQSSLKVFINAGYGVFGSEQFFFYCMPVAESTTAFARDAIMSTKDFVENTLGVRVLYGDTDSVFLYQPKEEDIEKLFSWGMKNVGVELGTDYVFRYVVFSDRKKNYFGITKRDYVIVKGLMGKKSNTPQIIRKNFSKMLEILQSVHEPHQFDDAKKEIISLLQNMIHRLETNDFSAEDISIRLVLSKPLKEYDTWTQTVQVAAQLLSSPQFSGDVSVGTTLQFIKVAEPFSIMIPPESNHFSFAKDHTVYKASVKPIELVDPEKDLNGKPVIEMAESTFSQILTSIGLSWNDVMGISSIDNFF